MMDKDKLVLDLTENEALSEYFSRLEPGDTCTITIDGKYELEGTIDEVEPDKMVILSLSKEEVTEDEKQEAKAAPKEPVDAVMALAGTEE